MHGDKLYKGLTQIIAQHLDTLAERDIVPTFPRTGIMMDTSTIGTAGSGLASGNTAGINGKPEIGASGSGGSLDSAANESEAVEMALEGERFLRTIKLVWEDHIAIMKKMQLVLKYMDKVYTPSAKVPNTFSLGLRQFEQRVIHSPLYPIGENLISVLLAQIRLERRGEVIHRSAIRDVISIISTLRSPPEPGRRSPERPSIYVKDFEGRFLDTSEAFYTREAEENLLTDDATILDKKLLSAHLETILRMPGSGLIHMIDTMRISDLQRVYRLYIRPNVTEGLSVLMAELKKYVSTRGHTINENVTANVTPATTVDVPSSSKANTTVLSSSTQLDPVSAQGAAQKVTGTSSGTPSSVGAPATTATSAAAAVNVALRWVQEVLDLKDTSDRVWKEAFEEDKAIQTALNDAFQSFINVNPKAQEYTSLFIDDNLKKGLKGKTENEVEAVLEKTIVLFRFIIDKDIFERYYKSHLAKRLLNNRSVSEDAERNMVAKLKVESGYSFTQKLEGMFNDMRLSTDMMKSFEKYLAKNDPLGIDLNVNVLTSTFWPGEGTATTCVFPPVFNKAIQSFEKFYNTRHSGRRLTWQSNHGTADIRVAFKARRHELNVSTHCAVILLLFENVVDGEELTVKDIKEATQIPESDLFRSLQSLACAKFKILTKTPKSRDVGPDDQFSFNNNFTCPLAKIKIQTIVGKVENTEERAETQEKVDEERKHQIEACIVRIMKDKKTLGHNELVNEVIRQLMARFTPTPAVIKKRIENLIDREYLERSEDMRSYVYLA
ncbi:hypothetical protein QFC22_004455 [Naganishia vaughanmartiniae]|uniref:Uncharacterized protein n=1 Tax=Naganishia vaughanmartiniae TaxID=1424756 RepID=A0ACC2X201_9TREE|nr:hypothetical protein QFC22_004455 [Naganishia vaughanmartiniae]